MPKSRQHWGYDLLTVLLVAVVAAFVFWVVPARAQAVALRCASPFTSDTIACERS